MTQLSSWFHGIKGKLLLAAALPIVGFGVANIISSTGISKINFLLSSSHKEIIPNIEALQEMRHSSTKFAFHVTSALAELESGRQADSDIKEAHTAMQSYEKAYKEYVNSAFMPDEKKAFEAIKGTFPQMIALMEKIHSLVATHDLEKAKEAHVLAKKDFTALSAPVSAFSSDTLQMYRHRAESEGKLAATTQSEVATWTMATIIISNIFISGYLLWLASNMSNTMATIASSLNQAASNVATSVDQLNHAGTGLSQSSTEAAASLEETVASLEELSSMVQMNSDNAKQAASLSRASREAAEKGQSEMASLNSSMTKISSSSKKIEEIIHVIDDIAFQTNLLALNAAVEAARAGEQGKGFAVVAEAVRSLAQRSASAAKDITHLIKESVQQVAEGSRLAIQSGEALNTIVNAVKKVSDLNNEISTASTEQTAGIQQISKAMNQLDQSSQSNAASAEEIAATGTEINGLAQTSLKLTMDLNKVIYGNQGAPHTESAPATTSVPPKTTEKMPVASREAKVIPLNSAPAAVANAKDAIPFDEDFKLGTTDGF
ncbi:chemotaxis protein [Bdellovibrio bacteriovorus]|uniref:Chemotaxis protein n=1 Tax=Bdellovibrio bacteriovorus TaxID=959 RepID=A0A150WHQ9_BDEBC|nr:methyl-accepting chemotaxis protein [Bdellovibrio bacteriovorus]KYG63077.1 chemotaxis protein [Bdellovibrio bacteriovorus]